MYFIEVIHLGYLFSLYCSPLSPKTEPPGEIMGYGYHESLREGEVGAVKKIHQRYSVLSKCPNKSFFLNCQPKRQSPRAESISFSKHCPFCSALAHAASRAAISSSLPGGR